MKDARLWYSVPGATQPLAPQSKVENVIVLSEEFWKEIQEHPIPVDLAVVKALADSPGSLDLYVWLVWRCWTARTHVSVPLFGTEGLICQLGISAHLRGRDFRRQIVHWLKLIQQLWPECPASLAEGGACLLIRAVKTAPKFSTALRDFSCGIHVTGVAQNT